MITRPMLSGKVESFDDIRFPVLASPKLDGIRCVKVMGKALTRKFKPLPNKFVREWIESNLIDHIDGELITYYPDGSVKLFNDIQSDIMSEAGRPPFAFCVFDLVYDSLSSPFVERFYKLTRYVENRCLNELKLVPHKEIRSIPDLEEYEEECLDAGWEGVMIRSPHGPYKCGRSTLREGYLLKIKRFEDSEAIILDFEEQEHNINPKEQDELGLTKRSHAQAGMVGADTLGRFYVEDINPDSPHFEKRFFIGTGRGLTHDLRKKIWENKELYRRKVCTYTYQKVGQKDLPRCPVWRGFRED